MTDHTESQNGDSLEGATADLSAPRQRREALDAAFDYRGNVTISTHDGREVQGYVFDRRSNVPEPYVRVIPIDSDERLVIPYNTIVDLRFSGRDTAAGRSWQAWVEKYKQKKSVASDEQATKSPGSRRSTESDIVAPTAQCNDDPTEANPK